MTNSPDALDTVRRLVKIIDRELLPNAGSLPLQDVAELNDALIAARALLNADEPSNLQCPECGAGQDAIQGGSVDIEGLNAIQTCTCVQCGAGWNDVYAFEQSVLTEPGRSD